MLPLNTKKAGVADGTRTHDNRNHNPGTYAKNSSTYAQFIKDSTLWEAAPVLEAIGPLLQRLERLGVGEQESQSGVIRADPA